MFRCEFDLKDIYFLQKKNIFDFYSRNLIINLNVIIFQGLVEDILVLQDVLGLAMVVMEDKVKDKLL